MGLAMADGKAKRPPVDCKSAERRQTKTRKMTPKVARFVDEYLIDLNATQAAIRAGYSAKTAQEQSSRLLSNVIVQAAIDERIKAREKRTEITQDKVLAELAKIGFSDIRKAVKWGDGIAVKDPESGAVEIANGVALVGSDEIDDATAASISEVSQTAQGLKIKMHDKRAALVDIGRHLGMFNDKVTLKGDSENPLHLLMGQLAGKTFKPVE